MASVVVQAVT